MPATLSSYLLQHIEELDESSSDEDISKEQFREFRESIAVITKQFLESRLGLTDQLAVRTMEDMLGGNRQLISDMFDDHYTRSLIKSIPKYVRRTVKLASLVVKKIPSDEARLYAREAGRNYVFGHWLSCIALARSALETSLRECIQAKGLTPDRDLRDLINIAGNARLLDGPRQQFAVFIQQKGNAIIHASEKNQPKEQVAFDTLAKLRGVLSHLYRDAEG